MYPSVVTLTPYVRRYFRAWLLISVFWWLYHAWQRWSYLIPSFNPEPQNYDTSFIFLDGESNNEPGCSAFSVDPACADYLEELERYRFINELISFVYDFLTPVALPLLAWLAVTAAAKILAWVRQPI